MSKYNAVHRRYELSTGEYLWLKYSSLAGLFLFGYFVVGQLIIGSIVGSR